MEYVLIRQSLLVRINCSNELSVWRIKCSQLYSCGGGEGLDLRQYRSHTRYFIRNHASSQLDSVQSIVQKNKTNLEEQ